MMGIQLHPGHISIDSYDYPLPDDRIAQFPLQVRDSSKLLIYRNGMISSDIFSTLASRLPSDSLIIFNETRVIHARLQFQKASGSPIEIFCLEPLAPYRDHQQALRQRGPVEWMCLVGNSKRWKNGIIKLRVEEGGTPVELMAERIEKSVDGTSRIKFTWEPSELTLADILEIAGKIPLPPYISRLPVARDELTYQTVYARQDGSVAAPTAGLHFSDAVLDSLTANKIDIIKFILHVGAGTFKPVTSGDLAGHEMHSEQVNLSVDALRKLRQSLDKPVIAVGTTTVRLLESLYWHGVKVINGLSDGPWLDVRQWDPYQELQTTPISREESLDAVINACITNGAPVVRGSTSLMIAPGYLFRYPDIIITNFHQPRSTLLLLIAAFIGEDWRKAYQYALEHDFRFLSYGDSCLFFKTKFV